MGRNVSARTVGQDGALGIIATPLTDKPGSRLHSVTCQVCGLGQIPSSLSLSFLSSQMDTRAATLSMWGGFKRNFWYGAWHLECSSERLAPFPLWAGGMRKGVREESGKGQEGMMWRWSQEKKKSNVLSQMTPCPCQGEGSGGWPRGPSASQDPRSREMPEAALCHARSLHTRAGLGSGGLRLRDSR